MTTSIRLNENEKEILRKKSVEINQQLIKKGLQPLRDSQIIHAVLEKALPNLIVSESGNIIIWNE